MSTLTAEILRNMARNLPPPMPEIRYSDAAVTQIPLRKYSKSRAKNAAHLRRMNNKWLRRYGTMPKPMIYRMNLGLTGLGRGEMIVAHPSFKPVIEHALRTGSPISGGTVENGG
jgi:hypothetical protein